MNPVLVELWRNDGSRSGAGVGAVGSVHRGALVLLDADGRTALAIGPCRCAILRRGSPASHRARA
jgi:L-asparaginase II